MAGVPELRRFFWQLLSKRGPDALRCDQHTEMEAPGAAHPAHGHQGRATCLNANSAY
jgi:hypothetical protein